MNNLNQSYDFRPLLAGLYWLEYEDAVEDANKALYDGNKLLSIAIAIQAHKIKLKYMQLCDELLY